MVDLDHCSYATIWACDKDCNRGNICHLLLALPFFSALLFLNTVISTLLSSFFCSYLDSVPVFSLSLSSTFQHFPTRPSSVLLSPPHLCHPSISLYWIWSCVIVSASLLGWRLSKGPQDPSHTEGLQPCQRCPLSSPPCVFSPHLLSLLSAHLVPLHLSGTEEKVKSFFFF